MFGWVGESSKWKLWLCTDVDLAADNSTSKSCSSVCCAMCGPTTFFPLCALSKKQGALSHSTAESEMVAADLGLRTEALALMTLFNAILKREIRLLFLEDNQSTLRIIMTGKNQALRHAYRTHRIKVHWISQVVREQPIDVGACGSHLMAGDLFTKCVGTTDKWIQVMKLIGHLSWSDVLRRFNQGSRLFPTDVKKENVKIQVDKPIEGKMSRLNPMGPIFLQ